MTDYKLHCDTVFEEGTTFPLAYEGMLDGRGSFRYISHSGGDQMVLNAARVSAQDVVKPSTDEKLLRYLLEQKHFSPFEHVTFTFMAACPLFTAAQWMRHRASAFNQVSGRYSVLGCDFYIPPIWHLQSKTMKQGGAGEIDAATQYELTQDVIDLYARVEVLYHKFLGCGVAKEEARTFLPVSTYTSFYWTVNLRHLLHFLSLRTDPHAQAEIRSFAHAAYRFAEHIAPISVSIWDSLDRPTLDETWAGVFDVA